MITLPDELSILTALKNWVAWKFEVVDGKNKKVPYNPKTGYRAQPNNPDTWSSYLDACSLAEKFSNDTPNCGIGFMFSEGCGYLGVDLDHCIDDNGSLSDIAAEIVNKLDSYTEVSPSGKGLHILCAWHSSLDSLGSERRNDNLGLEIYDNGRYFTVTGNPYRDAKPINDCSLVIPDIYRKYWIPQSESTPHTTTVDNSDSWKYKPENDSDILQRMFNSPVNGDKIRRLYEGDISGYNSQSEADLALCNHLAFYTRGNQALMDSLFRISALMRTKWDELHGAQTYGQMTIDRAIQSAAMRSEYTPIQASQNQNQQYIDDRFSKIHSLLKPFDTSIPVKKTEFVGRLYPKGYISIIIAPSGTGKSLFLQRDLYDNSLGGCIFGGIAENEPERKCIILCGELGEQGLREREQEFQFRKKTENVICLDQTKCEDEGITFMLNSQEGKDNIEYLASTKPDILAIDSFTAFFGGKENDNSECNAVFGFLRRIAAKYNVAIVITHHSRKRLSTEQGKPLTLDDAIGAGAITRHVYTVIAIEYQNLTGLNMVTCLKSWGKKFKPFGYKINNSCGFPYIDIELNPADANSLNSQSSNEKIKQAPEWQIRIQSFLLGRGSEGATLSEIMKVVGADSEDEKEYNTYRQRLSRMIKDNLIRRLKKGRYAAPKDKIIQETSQQLDFLDDESESE